MRQFILSIALALTPVISSAQDFSALDQTGVVGLMRHALAPGVGDPSNFDVADCSTQRNLSEAGREQARRTGAALRAEGLSFDAVWTSAWCRAKETAALMDVGPVVEVAALNSHFAGRGDAQDQARRVRGRLSELPLDARVLMVTHQVNIRALAGRSTASGEIVVSRREEDGGLTPIGTVQIAP